MGLGLGLGLSKSGYTPFTLTSVSSLALWLQNGVGVSAAQWNDSSGNNNHATQSTTNNQGVVTNGGIDFEEDDPGNNVHETFYGLASSVVIADEGGFCIAWVMDTESSTNNTLISDSTQETIRIQNASKIRVMTDAPTDLTSILHADSGPFGGAKALFLLNRTAGASGAFTLFKNGVAVTLDASSGDSTLGDAGENTHGFDFDTIGAGNSGSNHFFDGIIFELAFWTKSLNATEIADVNSYLKNFHGL
tara:strand:- start:34 stop:777 length:744 start_codon:yes stop_codon:yes gene_type:complete